MAENWSRVSEVRSSVPRLLIWLVLSACTCRVVNDCSCEAPNESTCALERAVTCRVDRLATVCPESPANSAVTIDRTCAVVSELSWL